MRTRLNVPEAPSPACPDMFPPAVPRTSVTPGLHLDLSQLLGISRLLPHGSLPPGITHPAPRASLGVPILLSESGLQEATCPQNSPRPDLAVMLARLESGRVVIPSALTGQRELLIPLRFVRGVRKSAPRGATGGRRRCGGQVREARDRRPDM